MSNASELKYYIYYTNKTRKFSHTHFQKLKKQSIIEVLIYKYINIHNNGDLHQFIYYIYTRQNQQ